MSVSAFQFVQLSRFAVARLAAAFPDPDRFQPQDPELRDLMEQFSLNQPHFPIVRLVLAAALVTVPLILRPFSKKAANKARLIRDIVVPPLIGVSIFVGQGNSLDCYLPEIVGGGVTVFSWIRRGIAWVRRT